MTKKKNNFEFHVKELTDSEDIKWLTGTKYHIELPDHFYEQAQLKRWCEENCCDVVVYITRSNGQYEEMYFFDEADAMACKLRWSE